MISPITLSNHVKSFRNSIKDRCQACWLNKYVKVFPELRNKLPNYLSASSAISPNNTMLSPFRIKMEISENNSTNIFSSSPNIGRLIPWSNETSMHTDVGLTDGNEFKSKVTVSNPLVENNSTFGSSPLAKPTIAEKPVIMVNKVSNTDLTVSPSATNTTKTTLTEKQHKDTKCASSNEIGSAKPQKEMDEMSRLRVRKKEKDLTSVSLASIVAPVPAPSSSALEAAKRQRIDLKGPRVKHVCRSASIVLGQPIATFPHDESAVLENMDTPPRPDSPSIEIPDMQKSAIIASEADDQEAIACTDCKINTPLSPPTTPISSNQEDEVMSVELPVNTTVETVIKEQHNESELEPALKVYDKEKLIEMNDNVVVQDVQNNKNQESLKPITRKLARPALLSNKVFSSSYKNLNSFSNQPIKQATSSVPLISIDFWENYDPAEVSQTGFGLIISEQVPLRALCFLCGSSGQDPLIFCVCCCEPYHQYCVEDEYNIKHTSLDDTNLSIMDATSGQTNTSSLSINNRLNWLCPRCTVCYTCNMASGSKVKCQKCQKNYHSTCLGTSKRLLGADRPLICANCLKCKSCGTTNVSKFVGNLPMCSTCFRLRQKGNFCPLCQKCYEDNDFNIKMMECGDCRRWVHAKCEGLTDEQYNMLSVLPENIEFICRKCAKNNSTADTWREAVAAEFKSGLLSVVRLLSKSRQACALLKLSPRKKPGFCVCQPVHSNRSILFNINQMETVGGVMEEDSMDVMDIKSKGHINGEQSTTSNDEFVMKCFCGVGQKIQQNNFSLLDIKQKVNTNEYYSLADFNYDMNLIMTAAACDELMVAYKEILSETFPWFQNETKACTDALEEDMYDSCNFTQNSPTIEYDQQVPMIGIPESDFDDYFYSSYAVSDTRICLFCKGIGEGISLHESRLLYCGQNGWVHTNCAIWSAEVFEEIDGSLQNVHSAISRGRLIKCSKCGIKGATVGCNVRTCGEHYHYTCARSSGCAFLVDKTVYCPQHLSEANSKACSVEKNFEIIRPVYVELDRKKKKFINPAKVQFMIGSLKVKQLGKFVSKLSDKCDVIVPAEFVCTRLYWSWKEPWKIVEYTVRTYVQNNNINLTTDLGHNFCVDHSNRDSVSVQNGLIQISKWHASLSTGDYYDYETSGGSSSMQGCSSDETNEDEPQNNADLLPPEIKDAIFEDLPHDILDGISMLDIFPKLMTYDDLVAMDPRNEMYLHSDMSRDAREYDMSDDDFSDNPKEYEGDGDNWIGSSVGLGHVEDAFLPTSGRLASSNATVVSKASRELKRSKSEVFSRGTVSSTSRSNQRSSSLTWNCKLDCNSVAAKRRKMSRIDLRIPDSVFLSLGRRKEDIFTSSNITERRLSLQQYDETKNKGFSWSATKKLVQIEDGLINGESFVPRDILDKLKISQLDGMDDLSSGSEGGSPIHEYTMNISYDPNSRESPVKCDRCHCTYRTYDSYHRHLPTCEPLSTSESESEATPRSPDMQSPATQNMVLTSINGQEYLPMIATAQNQHHHIQQQHHQQQSQHQIYNINGQQLSLQNMQGHHPLQIHNSQIQSATATNLQTALSSLQNPMQNVIINPTNGHQQIFSQPIGVQQQIFPLQNMSQTTNINQFSTNSGIEYKGSQTNQHQQHIGGSVPQTITLPGGINIQQQPQIITFSQASANPQIMTITQPTQQQQSNVTNFTTTRTSIQSSPFKNQLILPQPDKNQMKRQMTHKTLQQSPVNIGRSKGRSSTKPIQMKRTIVKTTTTSETGKPQVQMFSQPSMPNVQSVMRPVTQTDGNNIILQQNTHQPIIVQQLPGNQGNMVQYVTDNQNGMQYIALPTSTTNEFKHPQQPYLTNNSLLPGTYQIQTENGNIILTNSQPGIQVMPNGTLQLTQQQQPQVNKNH